jgi:hypothetical protein
MTNDLMKKRILVLRKMASDKLEKKRLKAQVKSEKKSGPAGEKPPSQFRNGPPSSPEKPWYKDPSWVRTIVAIVSLIVMIITLFITLYS